MLDDGVHVVDEVLVHHQLVEREKAQMDAGLHLPAGLPDGLPDLGEVAREGLLVPVGERGELDLVLVLELEPEGGVEERLVLDGGHPDSVGVSAGLPGELHGGEDYGGHEGLVRPALTPAEHPEGDVEDPDPSLPVLGGGAPREVPEDPPQPGGLDPFGDELRLPGPRSAPRLLAVLRGLPDRPGPVLDDEPLEDCVDAGALELEVGAACGPEVDEAVPPAQIYELELPVVDPP